MLKVSELFDSVQGEGPSAGEPCTFLRLAVCNLRCAWCDTRYSWDFKRYNYDEEVRELSVADVFAELTRRGPSRLVITGGEPLLQQPALAELLSALPPELVVEVETNGTLVPEPALLERVNQWNVSPKLSNAGDPEHARLKPEALSALCATGRGFLKLVIGDPADLAEATGLFRSLGWPRDRIFLMPEAANREQLQRRLPMVSAEAARLKLRVSPRLHVERWDGERGR